MSSNIHAPKPEPESRDLRSEGQRWVRRRRILYTILGIYAVLSLMWFAIDMADGTESLWFYWPMLGTALLSPSRPSFSSASAARSESTGSSGRSSATSSSAAVGTRPGRPQTAGVGGRSITLHQGDQPRSRRAEARVLTQRSAQR